MQYMMGLKYEPDSIQLVESDKLLEQCRQAGIEGERLYCSREIEFDAISVALVEPSIASRIEVAGRAEAQMVKA